jgi:SAM-dependent methyltransferase/uncharacterized protein (DUF2062 family)
MTQPRPRTPGALQRAFYYLRTEGSSSPSHDAWAIGLGLFIGCSPLIGLHLGLCFLAGWIFGLNRVKLYLAANLINPLIMPIVMFTEIQVGSWVRRGQTYPISLDGLASLDPWHFGLDLFIGSLFIGGAIGSVVGFLTFATLGRALRDPAFAALVKSASDRYLSSGITAWEFARAKLRNDPVYRQAVTAGLLPVQGALLDIGCGQGLLLAIVAAAREAGLAGTWPAEWAPPPRELTLAGIELRPRVATIAREALAGAATIQTGNILDAPPVDALDVIVMFDVLHLLAVEEQERLLSAVVSALKPGGRLLLREADAAGGSRFQFVRFGNRLTALVQRRWRATFAFRTADEWRALLARHGLQVDDAKAMGTMAFANVMLVGTKPASASADARRDGI